MPGAGGEDLGVAMVGAGMAWAFTPGRSAVPICSASPPSDRAFARWHPLSGFCVHYETQEVAVKGLPDLKLPEGWENLSPIFFGPTKMAEARRRRSMVPLVSSETYEAQRHRHSSPDKKRA
jgi:hypothetical protein